MYAGENGPERRGMLVEEGSGKLRPNLRQTVRSPDCETQTRAGANVGTTDERRKMCKKKALIEIAFQNRPHTQTARAGAPLLTWVMATKCTFYRLTN